MQRRKAFGPIIATAALVLATLTVPLAVRAEGPAPATAVPEAAVDLIAVVDQGPRGNGYDGQKIQFLKRDADWRTDAAAAWTLDIPGEYGWGHVTDVKTRIAPNGDQVVLVSAGGGMVGAFTYPGGDLVWSADTRRSGCGKEHNPHSIELIPRVPGVRDGGQYVVADSKGYVIYYPVGVKKPKCKKVASAHGVLYSDGRLWAVGYNGLFQYDILVDDLRKVGRMLTVKGFQGGHDLAPDRGSARHGFWVTDHNRLYTFDKYAGDSRFKVVRGPKGGSCVKSVGDRGGEVAETRPCRTNGMGAPAQRCQEKYQTHVVDFYTGNARAERKLRPAGCFYKARPVVWDYY
ncbi:hypothetical protein [Phytomonospora endophytica]|uniref:Uncharacterized protein n=1 Tax=Phytomonospora endophytica TaxID=714109 RepID=A0A841FER0_9ACTN|nr:hypothetical protein [Phytomonospora endophytica]MBB6034324.1 hypothetical protein [Phytomonospora endophytica]GIG66719.1 hypothetical protein Pen01_30140 [Phytomonospora endophytica]